jgi:hypothetical protein
MSSHDPGRGGTGRRWEWPGSVEALSPLSAQVQTGDGSAVAGERDFDERLAAVARELVHEPDTQHTLQRIVELAAANLDGEVYASVSLLQQRWQVHTPAASDERATRADRLQYEVNQGPCLDAIWEQDTCQIDDMTTEERYPDWARGSLSRPGSAAACPCSCSPTRTAWVR